MWDAFNIISTNLEFPIENIILILVNLSGLIFAAKDFRLATIFWFVANGGMFLWFYQMAQNGEVVNWTFAIVTFLIVLAFMSLNLFNIKRNEGVVI